MGPGSWGEPKELRRNEGAAERLSMVSGELPVRARPRAGAGPQSRTQHAVVPTVRDSCCSSSAKCQRRHHPARGSLTRCKQSGASTGQKLNLQAPQFQRACKASTIPP